MKKIIVLFLFSLILLTNQVNAQSQPIEIYFFWGNGCPHCEKEKIFLDKLVQKYPEIKVRTYEVWGNEKNLELMIELGKKLNAPINGVPLTIIGDKYFSGWLSESSTGVQIENIIKSQFDHSSTTQDKKIVLPVLGEIDPKTFSLPVLTVVIGLLDGFNPCAMWTLFLLISLLLGMTDRRKMWILGLTFIIVSAFVYFLFMAAWLNLILFIGAMVWVRLAIGLVALLGGAYSLKGYFSNHGAVCEVTDADKKQKIFKRMKEIIQQKSLYLALGGIIVLAFVVNLIELVCSAGFPAIYTQVLSLNNLSWWQYYLYLLAYLFFFMLDDMVVFVVAMLTLKMTSLTDKYSRWSRLIGGVLMLLIGLLLIFKPSWLMFG